MSIRALKTAIVTCLLVLGSTSAFAENPLISGYVEAKGMGTVDMSKTVNKIQAKLLAKRAAKVDAQRNLLEEIDGVRVTSGTTVKDAQLESDIIANRVKGLLKGAFVVDDSVTSEDGDLLAEVTLGICVTRKPPQCHQRSTLSQVIYDSIKKPKVTEVLTAATDKSDTAQQQNNGANASATGLVIDATGIDFAPGLDARVVNTEGKEVYGAAQFDIASGGDWLHWAKSIDEAVANADVVGPHPMVVKATAAMDGSKAVISDTDATRAFYANRANGNFFSKGKVTFVVR
ncbi:MAG TPA: hypothetical protein VJ998_00770 [Pseudomonadales bacterium]|nr:hypothetical protein [Pseudomonadales bacterium]